MYVCMYVYVHTVCAPAEEVLLRERISALENLLYQSMETQAEAEHRCLQLVETSSQSLQRCEMALNADNDLFSSLKMQVCVCVCV